MLFTVSRHETFKSDHKADMQLLFYTLNQTSERYHGDIIIAGSVDIF